MSIKDIASGRSDMYSINPELIQIQPGFNVRVYNEELDEHIKNLASSIATIGIQKPIDICMDKNTPILVDGFCRLSAVFLANETLNADIKTVPVKVVSYDIAERTLGLYTRNSSYPLSLFEQSIVVDRLIGYKWDEERICHSMGCSISHVKNLILLAGASETIKDMVIADQVSASNAIEAVRTFGAKAEAALLEAVGLADSQGKKKVTRKQLTKTTKKPKVDWKHYGPLCRDMIELIVESADTKEVREANFADAKKLLEEMKQMEK